MVNKKGSESGLGRYYDHITSGIYTPRLTFTWVDFHNDCKSMNDSEIKKFQDLNEENVSGSKYFRATLKAEAVWEVLQTQSGIIRTNCMDCLDRTNNA